MDKCVVIFGGSGYIGGYTLNYLMENNLCDIVILADIKEPRKEVWSDKVHIEYENGNVRFVHCDVRAPIYIKGVQSVSYIYNYAAIHREPGHEPFEYYETNINGAENVVKFADDMDCSALLFTSSIAPYGHSNGPRTETSPVVPYSPYGSSKLVAEKIHEGWHKVAPHKRKLIIVRPGVIYGPHEDGNVPRLRDALKSNFFCYVGNKEVQKAGGYVKELVRSMFWVDKDLANKNETYALYNFSNAIPPTLQQYVDLISQVLNKKIFVPSLPYALILFTSRIVSSISKMLSIEQPIHPDRIKKLRVNNIIIPNYLIENGYEFKYSVKDALLDWKADVPDEWT